ncbi:MAG: metal ABC transporter substrate-binding protein [Candidatus Neoclostridium sp.]
MKKILIVFITLALLAGALSGCALSGDSGAKYKVLCTVFSEYDWVREIASGDEDVEVKLLGDGVDMHNYSPGITDTAAIKKCDMFVYVGGASDNWVSDQLENKINKNMKVVRLFDALSSRLTEEDEMDEEEHENHDHDEAEYDEHVWLSLKNAVIAADAVRKSLCEMNPEKSDLYNANYAAYKQKLEQLDAQYAEAVEKATVRTLVFADRFPFRYMTDDYNIEYYAAFPGCASQGEISPRKMLELAAKIDEFSLKSVIILEGSSEDAARSIIDKTQAKNQSVVRMDSMQSVTNDDIRNGKTYVGTMQNNLNALKTALEVV